MTLSRPFKEGRQTASSFNACRSLGDRRCAVLGFVSTGNVSSSSTLQIFRDAKPVVTVALPATVAVPLLRNSRAFVVHMYFKWTI